MFFKTKLNLIPFLILKNLYIIVFMFWSAIAFSQHNNSLIVAGQEQQQMQWVDSIYNKMSLKEKIGQLYIVDIFSQAPKASTDRIKTLIRENHIGGVIFSKGGPGRQAILNNEYQDLSKVPLLIGMDAEWGLAMRLDSTFAYPWNMTMGAVNNNKLIEEAGAQIGKHAKRLGVHINFAPSVDVNNNPKNPIIGNRSFGEDPKEVTAKATAFIKGMEGVGTSSSIKHFPGHGNTDQDSHLNLPLIKGTRADLDKVELYPYKEILEKNITSAVMTSHLHVPALDNTPKLASSLSHKIITGVLKDEYNFEGLIYTDALNMKGVTDGLKPGEADLKAFMAGTDILLIPQNIHASQKLFLEAYNKGELSEERLAHSVKKILLAKYKAGLHNYKPVALKNLHKDLNTPRDHQLYKQIMEEAVTLVKNNENAIPFANVKNKKFAYIALGNDSDTNFLATLKNYSEVEQIKAKDIASYNTQAKKYTDLIVVLHKKNDNPWQSYKFSNTEINTVQELAKSHKVHLVVFASPYSLLDLNLSNLESVTVAYQNHPSTQEVTAQILFGSLAAKGSLPVSISKEYPVGYGVFTKAHTRLGFSSPEEMGLDPKTLNKIDDLVEQGLKKK